MTSDWECLKAARNGDEEAWLILSKRYKRKLINMTALITGCEETAQDLTQDTFCRLLNAKVKNYAGSFQAYIATIAYRLALKARYRMIRNRNIEEVEIADESSNPAEEIIRSQENRLIFQTVNSLEEGHRDVLILRFYGGLNYEEIATAIGIPIGTVKSRIFYAVKSCRQKLKEKGVIG